MSAERLAEDVDPTEVAKQWQRCQQQGVKLGVPIFSTKPRPRKVVEKLVAATKVDEKGVLGYLRDQATQLASLYKQEVAKACGRWTQVLALFCSGLLRLFALQNVATKVCF